MNDRSRDPVKDMLQVVAILCAIAFFSMLLHKGYADIWGLAQQYSGAEFWLRLGRYLIANLAGG